MFSRGEWGEMPVLASPTDLVGEVGFWTIRIHNIF